MLRRLHGRSGLPTAGNRTIGELLTGGERARARRQEAAKRRDATERLRREEAAAAARNERLDLLARDPESAWEQVSALIETKRAREYDAATALLEELRMLAERSDDLAAFAERMMALRTRNARKPSLMDRFDRAELP